MMRINRKAQSLVLALAALVILLLLWIDPYSRGRIGADFAVFAPDFTEVPLYPWQIGASVGLSLLLGIGVVASLLGFRRMSMLSLATESAAFVLVNALYVARDGVYTRATVGDQGAMEPGMLTVLGLAIRIAVLLMVSQSREVRR